MSVHKGPDVSLPVGENLGWDEPGSGEEEQVSLNNVTESGVLAHSLKQSRGKWLWSTFPKFAGKARGNKATEPAAQPNTPHHRGRCDVVIGPHTFFETSFYEIEYHPIQPQPLPTSYQIPPPRSTSVQTSYGAGLDAGYTGIQVSNLPAVTQVAQPLSPESSMSLTPELMSQVKTAAASNPTLAHLLQVTIAGKATPDQLQRLGLLINELRVTNPASVALPSSVNNSQPNASSSANLPPAMMATTQLNRGPPLPPVKEFDLVIEFQEIRSERWLVPRGPSLFEWQNNKDATLTLRLPFEKSAPVTGAQSGSTHKQKEDTHQAVSLLLKDVHPGISDVLTRWIGGKEKVEEYRGIFQALEKPTRLYLGYQLPSGPLLAQLNLLAQPYPMKYLKHGALAPRPPRPKKVAPPAKITVAATTHSLPAQPTKNRPSATPAPKRQKTFHLPSTEIACLVCKKKDVPLILGGRFCRPCVESGRAGSDPSYHIAPYPRPHIAGQAPPATPAPGTLVTTPNQPNQPTPSQPMPSASSGSTQ